MRYVIVVSGPVGVGKSSFFVELLKRFGGLRVSTRQVIIARTGAPDDRKALQAIGERLDHETGGAWVAEEAEKYANRVPEGGLLLIDAARIRNQVDHLRRAFGEKLVHIHLTGPDAVLSKRYRGRRREMREFETYEELRQSATESTVEELGRSADVVVNTDRKTPASVVAEAVSQLGLFPMQVDKLVDVIVGAQYGSEGKGKICAYLASRYDLLMRVGGPNAGHKVAEPEYTYVQIPSGTGSNPKAKLLIGAGATIWVPTLLKEAADWDLSPERLSVDPQAMIILQSDRDLESKSLDVIGSTKQGVGAATARKVIGRDGKPHLGARVQLARDVPKLAPYVRDTKLELENAYAEGKRIMLEGTQGTDLSLHHAHHSARQGGYPDVTSRETTAAGCLADAGIAPLRVRKVVMVTRTYPIRVGGTSGELPGETRFQTIATRSGLPLAEIEETEIGTVSGKPRRIGEFDLEQVRRAAVLNGATDIALTFADYLSSENRKAAGFEELTDETRDFITTLEKATGIAVSLISAGVSTPVIERGEWD